MGSSSDQVCKYKPSSLFSHLCQWMRKKFFWDFPPGSQTCPARCWPRPKLWGGTSSSWSSASRRSCWKLKWKHFGIFGNKKSKWQFFRHFYILVNWKFKMTAFLHFCNFANIKFKRQFFLHFYIFENWKLKWQLFYISTSLEVEIWNDSIKEFYSGSA